MELCCVYITFDTREAAEVMVAQLVKERLAAGVNYLPVRSIFWWNAAVQEQGEWVAILHTRRELWPDLRIRVKTLHSYVTPCIIKWDIEASPTFTEWVMKETRSVEES